MTHGLLLTGALLAVILALAISILAIERLATSRVWATEFALILALACWAAAVAIALTIVERG
jgi:hypothetical protein